MANNPNDSYNGQFKFGNSGANLNNVLNDINPDKQTKGNLKSMTDTTLSFYTQLYGKLETKHKTYLGHIKTAELDHYSKLAGGKGQKGLIYEKYDDLYKRLEKRHAEYLNKINGGGGNKTNVAGWVGVSGKENKSATEGQLAEAGDITSVTGDNDIEKLLKGQANITTLVNRTANNQKAFAEYIYSTNKNNKETSRYAEELRREVKSGNAEAKKNQEKENKAKAKLFKGNDEIEREIIDLVDDVGRVVVQGNYTRRVFDDILKTVKIFQKQESVADSIVGVVIMVIKEIVGFIGDGIQDLSNTYEETYTNFGLYFARADDKYEQTALYESEMRKKLDVLRQDGKDNNVSITEWWKKQSDLLSKGFSVEQSQQASLENVILSKIAPSLDTNNQYFLDLQQQGLFQLTHSMGGLVEAVRDTAGSSRITVGSLGTIIDKLAPVELYTKRELLGDTAKAYLSALENTGMSTADAINLVSDSIDAYYDPYKGLTSGNVLQRVALAQSGGNPSDPWQLIEQQLGLAGMFTGGTNSALTQGAVNSVLGASWLNARANYGSLYTTFEEELAKALESGTLSPDEAYQDLEQAFRDDILQTAEQMMVIDATNSETASALMGLVKEISLGLEDLIHTIMPKISDAVMGIAEKLGVYMGGKEYQDKELNEALNATSEEEMERHLSNAKNSAYVDVGMNALYDSSVLAMLGRGFYTKVTTGEFETPWDRIKKVYSDDIETIATANTYKNGGKTPSVGSILANGTPIVQAGKAYKKYMIDKPIEWAKGLFGSYATGGYVGKAELAVVGDNPYGEIISPIPQLSSAVMRGVNLASKNNKPDTTDVEAVIREVGVAIVKAIAENGGSIYIDSSSGLMSGNMSTSLKPIMSGKGGH